MTNNKFEEFYNYQSYLEKSLLANTPFPFSSNINYLHNIIDDKFFFIKNLQDFFVGVNQYYTHPYKRVDSKCEIIWQEGSTRLIKYNPSRKCKNIILFIPSLINKSYILDLKRGRSLVKYLCSQGNKVFVLDWNEPHEEELNFSLNDYIKERVEKALSLIYAKTRKKITVIGYCMGGMMAIAASLRNAYKLNGVALLATPWDFRNFNIQNNNTFFINKKNLIDFDKKIPSNLLQSYFYFLNFDKIFKKFVNLTKLPNKCKKRELFVAVERWVNDGISLSPNILKEFIDNFIEQNHNLNNEWVIDKTIIDPTKLKLPTFFAIPQNDNIVPPSVSIPLAELIHNKTIYYPTSGHIGMIIGSKAKAQLWEPLSSWIKNLNVN